MNERIKELIKQATSIEHGVDNGFDMVIFDKEKFAELIVKECASVAQDFVTVENNKAVEKIHISPWHLQDKIKEHFGVEE